MDPPRPLLLSEMMRSHVIKMSIFTQPDEQRCCNERYNLESIHNIVYLRDREVVMYSVSSRQPMTLTNIEILDRIQYHLVTWYSKLIKAEVKIHSADVILAHFDSQV